MVLGTMAPRVQADDDPAREAMEWARQQAQAMADARQQAQEQAQWMADARQQAQDLADFRQQAEQQRQEMADFRRETDELNRWSAQNQADMKYYADLANSMGVAAQPDAPAAGPQAQVLVLNPAAPAGPLAAPVVAPKPAAPAAGLVVLTSPMGSSVSGNTQYFYNPYVHKDGPPNQRQ
jgi:hypothetical protein